MKPGYKTTEFWISMLAVLIGGVQASGLIPAESAVNQIIGTAVVALVSLGYTGSRLNLKKSSE